MKQKFVNGSQMSSTIRSIVKSSVSIFIYFSKQFEFIEEIGVNGTVLVDINDNDLEDDFEIGKRIQRVKILTAIKKLKDDLKMKLAERKKITESNARERCIYRCCTQTLWHQVQDPTKNESYKVLVPLNKVRIKGEMDKGISTVNVKLSYKIQEKSKINCFFDLT